MNRYEKGPQLGAGSFGTVFLVTEKATGKKRAMKHLNHRFKWNEVLKLRELQMLMGLSRHDNIVKIYEVILTKKSELYFCFEYMDSGSLYDLIVARQRQRKQQHSNNSNNITNYWQPLLQEHEIQSMLHQVLTGLAHMHAHGYMHRDMKPENILLSHSPNGGDGHLVAKVADFSLARRHRGSSTCSISLDDPLTMYVSTRWYRAPEVMVFGNPTTTTTSNSSSNGSNPGYGPAVDAFAMACIAAECYTGQPIFPGQSEVDQLHLIFKVLGRPTLSSWKQGWEYLQATPMCSFSSSSQSSPTSSIISNNSMAWSPTPSTSGCSHHRHPTATTSMNGDGGSGAAEYHAQVSRRLHQAVPMASPQSIDLMVRLLRLDPNKRLTCRRALQHGFLRTCAAAAAAAARRQQEQSFSPSSKPNDVSPGPVPVQVSQSQEPPPPLQQQAHALEATREESMPMAAAAAADPPPLVEEASTVHQVTPMSDSPCRYGAPIANDVAPAPSISSQLHLAAATENNAAGVKDDQSMKDSRSSCGSNSGASMSISSSSSSSSSSSLSSDSSSSSSNDELSLTGRVKNGAKNKTMIAASTTKPPPPPRSVATRTNNHHFALDDDDSLSLPSLVEESPLMAAPIQKAKNRRGGRNGTATNAATTTTKPRGVAPVRSVGNLKKPAHAMKGKTATTTSKSPPKKGNGKPKSQKKQLQENIQRKNKKLPNSSNIWHDSSSISSTSSDSL